MFLLVTYQYHSDLHSWSVEYDPQKRPVFSLKA